MTHTKGHWDFVQDTRFTYEKYCVNHQSKHHIEAGLSTLVAEISEGPHGLANARLIAAAPELLEGLRKIIAFLDSAYDGSRPTQTTEEFHQLHWDIKYTALKTIDKTMGA